MNECAHAWIAVTLPMLVVGVDIVGVLADAYESSLVEERDFALHQGLHPFDTIHLLEQRLVSRVAPQVAKMRVDLDPREAHDSVCIGTLRPHERKVLLAAPGIYAGGPVGIAQGDQLLEDSL